MYDSIVIRFRPLIRGFFFYDSKKERDAWVDKQFPSPHSGILFLLKELIKDVEDARSFRPLIRGFFFYDIFSFAL